MRRAYTNNQTTDSIVRIFQLVEGTYGLPQNHNQAEYPGQT